LCRISPQIFQGVGHFYHLLKDICTFWVLIGSFKVEKKAVIAGIRAEGHRRRFYIEYDLPVSRCHDRFEIYLAEDLMRRKGLICIYTGNGKGKTTAAIGAAIRAVGQGLKVLILQFMKGQKNIGELKVFAQASLPITLKQFGRRAFFQSRACEQIDILKANVGLQAFQKAMESEAYDLIVLDEINMAIDFGLLQIDEVMAAIKQKPPGLHLILTGRNAKEPLMEIADLVTEMKEVKHHYQKGVNAQKGIEF